MHRVELKVKVVSWAVRLKSSLSVPNAPCGVERYASRTFATSSRKFLMHRVELKDRVGNQPVVVQTVSS